MVIRVLVTIILAVYSLVLANRYNLHMFQLNGYKINEQLRWLKKNIRQQWVLIATLIFGFLRLFINNLCFDIFVWFFLYIVICVFGALKRLNNKKTLVYTARVKRLIITEILLVISISFISVFMFNISYLIPVLLIMIGCCLFNNIISNIINKPMEYCINKYYLLDAKRKLKAVDNILVIGVTGSYGKTSVKFYLKTLLQDHFNVLITPESYNTPMGVVKTIRSSLHKNHEIFVCEMGARYTGDIKEICDIVNPKYGIITSVGPQHLETFGSIENIVKTKFELADEINKDGFLFLNCDNEYIEKNSTKYNNVVKYHTMHSTDGYHVVNVKLSRYGTDFTVIAPNGETAEFQMKLIGEHNIINVVGAISVANKLGINLQDLKIPVRRLRPVPHRMEMKDYDGITIIDDAYNSNPVGSKAAVETLKMFDGIRILITPGMVELGKEQDSYNYDFGKYSAKCCDYILLVGKKNTKAIYNGAIDAGFISENCLVFDTLQEALAYAYKIKGSNHKYILLENDLPDNY